MPLRTKKCTSTNETFSTSSRSGRSDARFQIPICSPLGERKKGAGHFYRCSCPARAVCNPVRSVNLELSLHTAIFSSPVGRIGRGGRCVGRPECCADDTQEKSQLPFQLEATLNILKGRNARLCQPVIPRSLDGKLGGFDN